MTATSRAADDSSVASDAAASLRGAPLARLLVRRDGDAVAAAGVLARALRAVDVPVQASPTVSRPARERRATAGDPDAVTVAVGPADDADVTIDGAAPAVLTAVETVRELDVAPAPELALAGVVAAGEDPDDVVPDVLETARERGVERRPGVGLATDDLATGLAGSTLFHASFSGDPDGAAEALADAGIDPGAAPTTEQRRTLASLVALSATEGPAPERAATTVERALRPLAWDGAAPTIEGYADALDVAATVDPALALAHALGDGGFEPVRATWREYGPAVHAALADADPARYDGVAVFDASDAPAPLVARLARDARSPEPVAVALGDDAVGLAATTDDCHDLADAVAAAADGTPDGTGRRGVVHDAGDYEESAIVDAIRARREADRDD